MAFVRNTGDFIRILRICYTKPFETDDSTLELISDGPSTSSFMPPPPPPAPIYLNCRNIFSTKNSTSELKSKLYEFLREAAFSPSTDTSHRWRLLTAESLGIFTSNAKKSEDLWENSFHAISISSSTQMNRCAFDGINIFYDTGFFGKDKDEDPEKPDDKKGSKALVPKRKIPCSIVWKLA